MWLRGTVPFAWRPDKTGVILANMGSIEHKGRMLSIVQVSEHWKGCFDRLCARARFPKGMILLVNYADEKGTRFRNVPLDESGLAPDKAVVSKLAEHYRKYYPDTFLAQADCDDWIWGFCTKPQPFGIGEPAPSDSGCTPRMAL